MWLTLGGGACAIIPSLGAQVIGDQGIYLGDHCDHLLVNDRLGIGIKFAARDMGDGRQESAVREDSLGAVEVVVAEIFASQAVLLRTVSLRVSYLLAFPANFVGHACFLRMALGAAAVAPVASGKDMARLLAIGAAKRIGLVRAVL